MIRLLLAAVLMSGCSFVQRVDKQCSVTHDMEPICWCRDLDTGRFIICR